MSGVRRFCVAQAGVRFKNADEREIHLSTENLRLRRKIHDH